MDELIMNNNVNENNLSDNGIDDVDNETVSKSTDNVSEQTQMRIQFLMSTINQYTDQVEAWDRSNFPSIMTAFALIGVLLTVFFSIVGGENEWVNNISVILLTLVFGVITMLLYNFANNCMRVAIYRGYLSFLEKLVNKEMDCDYGIFNSKLVPKFIGKNIMI